jgi:hypothetical protein
MPTKRKAPTTKLVTVRRTVRVAKKPAQARAVVKRPKRIQRGDGFKDDAYEFLKKNKKAIVTGLTLAALAVAASKGSAAYRGRHTDRIANIMSNELGKDAKSYSRDYIHAIDEITAQDRANRLKKITAKSAKVK